jgi:hypothetical protein
MEQVVHLFESFKTIFYFKFFRIEKAVFWISQNLEGFEVV